MPNSLKKTMGDLLGVSNARISDYEHQRRMMSKEIIEKVACVFNMPLERLL